jgi:hypothetical protein
MTLSALGIFSAAGAGGAVPVIPDYELISSTILGSAQASVTFSSLGTYSSTYKHLQIRFTSRSSSGTGTEGVFSRFNGDSGNNYTLHGVYGTGSSVISYASANINNALSGAYPANDFTANGFGAGVIDLTDAYASKFKTLRTFTGVASARVDLQSGLWRNTDTITSWVLFPVLGNWVAGSRFSLYGIKG